MRFFRRRGEPDGGQICVGPPGVQGAEFVAVEDDTEVKGPLGVRPCRQRKVQRTSATTEVALFGQPLYCVTDGLFLIQGAGSSTEELGLSLIHI